MENNSKSIRPFIGAANFLISRNFYKDLGFQEVVITRQFSLFTFEKIGFYLQDSYVKDWIDNTMVFLEVEDVNLFWNQISALNLSDKYKNVRILPIREMDWGKECFIHDPSGVLWHVGEFNK